MIEEATSQAIALAMTDKEVACQDSSTKTETLDTEISGATIEKDTTRVEVEDTRISKEEAPK